MFLLYPFVLNLRKQKEKEMQRLIWLTISCNATRVDIKRCIKRANTIERNSNVEKANYDSDFFVRRNPLPSLLKKPPHPSCHLFSCFPFFILIPPLPTFSFFRNWEKRLQLCLLNFKTEMLQSANPNRSLKIDLFAVCVCVFLFFVHTEDLWLGLLFVCFGVETRNEIGWCLWEFGGGNLMDQLIISVVPVIIDARPAAPAKMRFWFINDSVFCWFRLACASILIKYLERLWCRVLN